MKTASGYFTIAAAILLSSTVVVTPSRAQIIGLDFGDPSSLAGVQAQLNWNNLTTATGTSSAIVDSTGSSAGVTATWGANGVYGFGNGYFTAADPNQTGDLALYSGSIEEGSKATPVSGGYQGYFANLSVTGITYSSYDVIVYFESGNSDPGLVNLNGTGLTGTGANVNGILTGGLTDTFSSASAGDTGLKNDNYVAATGAGGVANYAEFTNVTGSSLSVYAGGTEYSGSVGIVGIQIIAVPEPSTYALLGLGALGLILIRRRRQCPA